MNVKTLRRAIEELDDSVVRLEVAVDSEDAAEFRSVLSHARRSYKAAVHAQQEVGRELRNERGLLKRLMKRSS